MILFDVGTFGKIETNEIEGTCFGILLDVNDLKNINERENVHLCCFKNHLTQDLKHKACVIFYIDSGKLKVLKQ